MDMYEDDEDPFVGIPPATRALVDYLWERVPEHRKRDLITSVYEDLYNVVLNVCFVAEPEGIEVPYEIFAGAEKEAQEESPNDPWQISLDLYREKHYPDKVSA
ncbi:hypothetical protein [Actinobaculum massiliense]|uniref:hypothetical protein n=1 Tax=Actinobaculum massiliense TaxID=202789 RepID=UPI00071AF195|nr:hypothetical protein [Actinobaculum massiliense]